EASEHGPPREARSADRPDRRGRSRRSSHGVDYSSYNGLTFHGRVPRRVQGLRARSRRAGPGTPRRHPRGEARRDGRRLPGPRGAGSSTPLGLVTGEGRPTRALVTVLDEDVRRLRRRGLARLRRELGIVSQSRPLLEDRTVVANVALVLRALGRSRREAWGAARETLAEVVLDELRPARARELPDAYRLRPPLAPALPP